MMRGWCACLRVGRTARQHHQRPDGGKEARAQNAGGGAGDAKEAGAAAAAAGGIATGVFSRGGSTGAALLLKRPRDGGDNHPNRAEAEQPPLSLQMRSYNHDEGSASCDDEQNGEPEAPPPVRILPLDMFALQWLERHVNRHGEEEAANGKGKNPIFHRYLDEQLEKVLPAILEAEARRSAAAAEGAMGTVGAFFRRRALGSARSAAKLNQREL